MKDEEEAWDSNYTKKISRSDINSILFARNILSWFEFNSGECQSISIREKSGNKVWNFQPWIRKCAGFFSFSRIWKLIRCEEQDMKSCQLIYKVIQYGLKETGKNWQSIKITVMKYSGMWITCLMGNAFMSYLQRVIINEVHKRYLNLEQQLEFKTEEAEGHEMKWNDLWFELKLHVAL